MSLHSIPGNISKLNIINHSAKQKTLAFTMIRNVGAMQYLYLGELKEFLTIPDNLAMFQILGRGDYDTNEQTQAEYHLFVRRLGTTNTIFVNIKAIKSVTDGDTMQFNEATAYINAAKNNGSVRVYLRCHKLYAWNMGLFDILLAKGTFTSALQWAPNFEQFTNNADFSGYTVHSGNGLGTGRWVSER